MPENTPNLDLYLKIPATDGSDTFNIETMLNQNFRKIDENTARVGADGKLIPSQRVNPTLATVAVDLNNYKTPGNYYVPTDITNTPFSTNSYYMQVLAEGALVLQVLYGRVNPNLMYMRRFNGTWGEWDNYSKGVTGGLAKHDDLTTHTADDARHVTTTDRTKWDNSMNAIAAVFEDPNITQKSYILTDHVNGPDGGGLWHIQTFFYNIRTGSRAQQAISYLGATPRFSVRHFYNNVWSAWSADPFQSVVDGKNSVESAIEAKGGTVSDVNNPPTFADLVAGVNGLSTGKKYATGTGTFNGSNQLVVTGLNFAPRMVIVNAPSISAYGYMFKDISATSMLMNNNGAMGTLTGQVFGATNFTVQGTSTLFGNAAATWWTYE